MLANLYNVFNDIKGMQQFSFSNADLHTRQNAAILAQYGVDLSSYVLDPIPLETALPNWLQTHQEIHNQVNQVLGIAGNDLTDVDFSKPDQVSSWIWLHAQEHLQASNKLGLT